MKAFTTKLTKYEIIERISQAKELIDIHPQAKEIQATFEYRQLNKLFERNYPHGYDEAHLFTKAQLVELATGLANKLKALA